MGEASYTAHEPRRDLILAIAVGLVLDGAYSIKLDEPSLQDLIDLHRSAREAGRLFGIPIALHTSEPSAVGQPIVTVTVTREGVDPRGADDRSRWEALLRAVDLSDLRLVEPDRSPDVDE